MLGLVNDKVLHGVLNSLSAASHFLKPISLSITIYIFVQPFTIFFAVVNHAPLVILVVVVLIIVLLSNSSGISTNNSTVHHHQTSRTPVGVHSKWGPRSREI